MNRRTFHQRILATAAVAVGAPKVVKG